MLTGRTIAALLLLGVGVWATGVMYFAGPGHTSMRAAPAASVAVVTIAAAVFSISGWRSLLAFTVYAVAIAAVSWW